MHLFGCTFYNNNIFLINYIWNLKNKYYQLFDGVLCIFRGSSGEAKSNSPLVSYMFPVISFPLELFSSQYWKIDYDLTWETLGNGYILIKFIMRFQVSKGLVYNV